MPGLVQAVMAFSGPRGSGAERSHIGVSGGMECERGCQRHLDNNAFHLLGCVHMTSRYLWVFLLHGG